MKQTPMQLKDLILWKTCFDPHPINIARLNVMGFIVAYLLEQMIPFMWIGINILIVSGPIDVPELCWVSLEICWVDDMAIVFVRLRSDYLMNYPLVACEVRKTTVHAHTCSTL